MKINKIWALVLVAVALSGCGASPSPSAAPDGLFRAYDEAQNAAAPMAAPQDVNGMADYAETESQKMDFTGESGVNPNTSDVERKIIRTAGLYMETYAFDNSVATMLDSVRANGGYVEKSTTWLYYPERDVSMKKGTFVVRVPQENFEKSKEEIEKIGKVLSSSMGGNDVTGQYYDIETRLNMKKEEEKRILDLIAKAEKVEDFIKLEQALSEIRTDIEIFQTRLNSIDRLSSFSTITVDLTEVPEKDKIVYTDDFLGKLKSGFVASINLVISFFQYAILFIAAIFVPALILGIIGLIVWKFIKKMKNKK